MRTVVITGGTSGIGKSCKDYFEKKGDIVVILARKNPENLDKFYACDVVDEKQVQETFKQINKTYGRIDVLINNAGYGLSGAVELIKNEDAKSMFDVNLFGVVNCTKASLPFMEKGGKIINISSVCALFPLQFRGYYCATKSALNMLTFSQNLECKPFGIHVGSVCPGDVKTNFTKNRVKIFDTNERYGDRIKNCAEKIDKKNDERMDPIVVAKATYKYSLKKNPKPFIIVGTKYKWLYFASKIVPAKLLHRCIYKMFG